MNPWAKLKLRNGTNGLKTAELRLKMADVLDDFPRSEMTNMSQESWSDRLKSASDSAGSSWWRWHFEKPRVNRFRRKIWVCSVLQPNLCHVCCPKTEHRRVLKSVKNLLTVQTRHYRWRDVRLRLWRRNKSPVFTKGPWNVAWTKQARHVHAESQTFWVCWEQPRNFAGGVAGFSTKSIL